MDAPDLVIANTIAGLGLALQLLEFDAKRFGEDEGYAQRRAALASSQSYWITEKSRILSAREDAAAKSPEVAKPE